MLAAGQPPGDKTSTYLGPAPVMSHTSISARRSAVLISWFIPREQLGPSANSGLQGDRRWIKKPEAISENEDRDKRSEKIKIEEHTKKNQTTWHLSHDPITFLCAGRQDRATALLLRASRTLRGSYFLHILTLSSSDRCSNERVNRWTQCWQDNLLHESKITTDNWFWEVSFEVWIKKKQNLLQPSPILKLCTNPGDCEFCVWSTRWQNIGR